MEENAAFKPAEEDSFQTGGDSVIQNRRKKPEYHKRTLTRPRQQVGG